MLGYSKGRCSPVAVKPVQVNSANTGHHIESADRTGVDPLEWSPSAQSDQLRDAPRLLPTANSARNPEVPKGRSW